MLNIKINRNQGRNMLIISSLLIVCLILWNTYKLIELTKAEERNSMELWALAQKEFLDRDLNDQIGEVAFRVLTTNTKNPMIQVDHKGHILSFSNIDHEKAVAKDSVYLKKILEQIKTENPAIHIVQGSGINQKLYYGHSSLLKKIQYYPLALLLIIVLFGTALFFYYRSSRVAIQNKLWAGMAKETAHQIGTPLSALMGWTTLLESESPPKNIAVELRKDVQRLETIVARFSKIGSDPKLEKHNFETLVEKNVAYLSARAPKQVQLTFNKALVPCFASVDPALIGWVIENLVKNSIDATQGKGVIVLDLKTDTDFLILSITDNGKGIPKKWQKKIFNPGVTTKKRGWGLGLSLAKRIVENFHNGQLRVVYSNDKGTQMEIVLKLLS